ncbi:major facilitator superfamily domain-containing protein [Suillus bovinus]|uniref:major facilitator superfamily domain-containing protein n=1 Tax=Suillus bovinus TaxID=48563 RepID=UPI001B87E0B1|nr:major facilitator superfamily domain-containing protein [Suillus bovinus]KAG2141386.1 major facilitator superfamily domain-containing protein [Suillus bovinus]
MPSPVDEKGGSPENDSITVYERPKGLRGVYYHPITQIVMLALVCFLCPGMFNALTGLGGGGQVNPTISANSTCAVYATYAFFAFFSGTVNNKIGAKRTLLFGTLGYALYVGSYLQVLFFSCRAINIHPGAGWFVVTSGALLGVTAAFLWTAQGSIMLSYCTEAQKGIFISIFWAVFNVGAVVGAAVSFGQNIKSTVGILVLTIIGITIPLLMADPDKMIRTDGTRVVMPRHPSWKSEFYGLWVAIITDPMILLLFPMFFASNYFYTWQFNDYNSALFNIRARSLNNFVYWLSQIIGSGMIGIILDSRRLRRRVRAFAGWGILLVMTFAVHVWAYYYQRTYTRASIPPDSQKMDIYDTRYPAHVWLMIFYGLLDAMWQTTSFWLIGAMSNDTNKLAIYSGFYHSIQSAGAAGVWRMDAMGLPYMNIFLSTWCLVVVGLVSSLPVIYLRIRDTTVLEDEGLMQRDQEIEMNINMKAKEMIESEIEMS